MCAITVGGGDSLVNTVTRTHARTLSLLNSSFGVTTETKRWTRNARGRVREGEWAGLGATCAPGNNVSDHEHLMGKCDSQIPPSETLAVMP